MLNLIINILIGQIIFITIFTIMTIKIICKKEIEIKKFNKRKRKIKNKISKQYFKE